jgi:hypothetical protein
MNLLQNKISTICNNLGLVPRLIPILAALILLPKCSQNFVPGPNSFQPTASKETSYANSPAPDSGAVSFQAPQGWVQEVPSSRMRRAQYRLAKVDGHSEDAEVLVFHFPGQGGSLEANARRWIGQMSNPDGSPVTGSVQKSDQMIGGKPVTLLDVSGTYQSSMRFSQGPAKPDYRLLGAMIETRDGPWFFKLTGPAKTVEKWLESWNDFINSIEIK